VIDIVPKTTSLLIHEIEAFLGQSTDGKPVNPGRHDGSTNAKVCNYIQCDSMEAKVVDNSTFKIGHGIAIDLPTITIQNFQTCRINDLLSIFIDLHRVGIDVSHGSSYYGPDLGSIAVEICMYKLGGVV